MLFIDVRVVDPALPVLLLESIVALLMLLTCRPTTRILGGSEAFLKQHK